jgi:hypothetical protein
LLIIFDNSAKNHFRENPGMPTSGSPAQSEDSAFRSFWPVFGVFASAVISLMGIGAFWGCSCSPALSA